MDRRYKQLLPALSNTAGGPSEPNEQAPSLTKRKRPYVKTACDICRAKKTACDRQRPACTPCTKRKTSCTFGGRPAGSDEMRRLALANIDTDSDSASIITALLTAHDTEAHNLLDRIRHGRGTLEVLRPWAEEDGDAERRPTILAPDQTSCEFELMTKHQVAYPALVPLDSHSEIMSTTPDRLQTLNSQEMDIEQDGISEKEPPGTPNLGPLGHASYDQRLRRIHFARWTNVPVSGSEAAAAIANYLAHDNVLLQLFDAELFLKDLAHDYGQSCTSLLVNALLGWSLPRIISTDDETKDPAGAAYETALRQLEAQEDRPATLSTLAAMELLSLTALFKGEGVKSNLLLNQVVLLGKQLNLVSYVHDPSYQANGPIVAGREDRSKATASWGLFSLTTMISFHCQCNHLEPAMVPAYTFPEIENGCTAALVSKHMSSLWSLIHEINSHFYRGRQNVSNEVSNTLVRSMLAHLLHWANELPVMLARGNRSTQEVMIMHSFLHAAIMTVAHPLALRHDSSPLIDGESHNRSAEAIHAASAAQMHRLVDLCHFHSHLSASNVFWHTALLFSANAAVRSPSGGISTRRWRFLRAMDGYADLHVRYPVMQVIFRGLMTMAVEVGLLGSQEAVKLARNLVNKSGRAGIIREEMTEACFVVDLELALVDRGLAMVDVLSQRFGEIIMFDDFTHENITPS